MNGENRKQNWPSLVKRVLSHENKYRKSLPNEWKTFSKAEVDLLFQLKSELNSFTEINDDMNISQVLQDTSQNFLEQCLYTSIEHSCNNFEEKCIPLYCLIEEMIADGRIRSASIGNVYQSVLMQCVKTDNIDALTFLLSCIPFLNGHNQGLNVSSTNTKMDHSQYSMEALVYPEYNNDALLKACNKNNYIMVQTLVSAGYR